MTDGPAPSGGASAEEKRALLERLLKEKRGRANFSDFLPSQGQKSLWFMHQLAPESPVYNVTTIWRADTVLDGAALEKALQKLVDRHAILRTTYVSRGSEMVQRVHERGAAGFFEVDGPPVDSPELEEVVVEMARQPFDLTNGPVLRIHLVRCDGGGCVMVLVIHHIACDLWSTELLLDELRTNYLAEVSGEAGETESPSFQYVDFARWQDELLRGEAGEQMWEHWQGLLGGDPEVVEVPTDRPRPAVQTFSGDSVPIPLDPGLVGALRSLAVAEGCTLFTVFLAAFQVLLGRYSGQSRVPVGSPLLGRSRPEFEEIIGYFVNPVVLVSNVEGDGSFRDFLAQVKQVVLSSLDHQDYPFPYLVERLQPVRDPTRLPLTDFYFAWDKFQRDGTGARSEVVDGDVRFHIDWGDVRLHAMTVAQVGTPSDLAMLVLEVDEDLTAALGFNTDLFDRATALRLAEHYGTLLRSIAQEPGSRVSALRMLSEAELDALTVRSDVPASESEDALEETTLQGRFEARVRETPTAPAVTFRGSTLTYAELDERAERLAGALRTVEGGPGSVVGLCVDRSPDVVVGVLGILKAGLAYLPLDPTNPVERLSFMLDDSQVRTVVASGEPQSWMVGEGRRVLDVTASPSPGAPKSIPAVQETEVAYVIYTSGSTGRPKGVAVTHANVLALLDACRPLFSYDANDVWTLFHSVAFDFSVWEIFGALLHGGRLVVVPFEVSRDPGAFLELLAEERVTVLNQTPSAFLPLITADGRADADLSALRWVIFGGEALDPASLRPWIDRHGDEQPRLVNMYGITETTVHVTFRRIMDADARPGAGSFIGRPLPHLYAYVLGPDMEPLPQRSTGELYVGGSGVAKEYLGRPELTAERFLADPFSDDPHARLYRTGDLARRLPNGELEYAGRADQQVKVRGFRIELGEIESVLQRHPDVNECVTVVREIGPGDRRLVSYVVGPAGGAEAVASLTELAESHLPSYMVPSAILVLEKMPLTPNGKIDRRALPLPGGRWDSAGSRSAETPLEVSLASLWEKLLGIENVGVDTDFFSLGGHSILVTQLMDRIRGEYDAQVTVASFFENPTIENLAKMIEEQRGDEDEDREEFVL